MDMRLKWTADTRLFRTEQAKMIYINSRLEGPVKEQLHPFIHDDLRFEFAEANTIRSILTSLYDDPVRRRRGLGNLCQRTSPFPILCPNSPFWLTTLGIHTDPDLLSVKLSDEINQLLVGQDMPADYLGYVTRLHILDKKVFVLQVTERICERVLDQTLLFWRIELVLTILLLLNPKSQPFTSTPSVINLLPLPKLQSSVHLSHYRQLYKSSQPWWNLIPHLGLSVLSF